jgi:hypothetical protein
VERVSGKGNAPGCGRVFSHSGQAHPAPWVHTAAQPGACPPAAPWSARSRCMTPWWLGCPSYPATKNLSQVSGKSEGETVNCVHRANRPTDRRMLDTLGARPRAQALLQPATTSRRNLAPHREAAPLGRPRLQGRPRPRPRTAQHCAAPEAVSPPPRPPIHFHHAVARDLIRRQPQLFCHMPAGKRKVARNGQQAGWGWAELCGGDASRGNRRTWRRLAGCHLGDGRQRGGWRLTGTLPWLPQRRQQWRTRSEARWSPLQMQTGSSGGEARRAIRWWSEFHWHAKLPGTTETGAQARMAAVPAACIAGQLQQRTGVGGQPFLLHLPEQAQGWLQLAPTLQAVVCHTRG